MGKKLTNEEFIKRSKLIHKDKYDYSLVNNFGNSVFGWSGFDLHPAQPKVSDRIPVVFHSSLREILE